MCVRVCVCLCVAKEGQRTRVDGERERVVAPRVPEAALDLQREREVQARLFVPRVQHQHALIIAPAHSVSPNAHCHMSRVGPKTSEGTGEWGDATCGRTWRSCCRPECSSRRTRSLAPCSPPRRTGPAGLHECAFE